MISDSTQSRPRVLYFGIRYEIYPRNRAIRQFLENEYNAQITIVRGVVHGNRLKRNLVQLIRALRAGNNYDLVILGEFGSHYYPYSKFVARRSKALHLVDFFVGKYESSVLDRATRKKGSLQARIAWRGDVLAIRSADICVTDAAVRAQNFSQMAEDETPFRVLPVGAPSWHIHGQNQLVAQLQNLCAFFTTATTCRCTDSTRSSMPWRNSNTRLKRPSSAIVRHGRVSRHRPRSAESLTSFASRTTSQKTNWPKSSVTTMLSWDIFGDSAKAASVIANKVWQGLFMGKSVVTRESEALAEIDSLCGESLVQVPARDADSCDRTDRHSDPPRCSGHRRTECCRSDSL